MSNEKQQTALQQLKSTIKDGIGNINGQLNDYKSGYKQCLIDIENLIDKQLLEMEKERELNAYANGQADTLLMFKQKISKMKDIPTEFNQIISENFWDLI
jgi:hypothetical protein